ncbi:MAG: phosphatidylglycerophosphatase A, partial [Candidatus Cloacimonetes bacterium]|nr:phosphatidylglycerophosphatase A [Candidatus Cloacimonadota bacterium]
NNIKSQLTYIIGTLFGIGFFPIMSGTIATFTIAIVWWLIPDYFFYNTIEQTIHYDSYLYLSIFLIISGFLSVFICTKCEKKFGHDASSIVIDEAFGYLFAILFLPKTLMIAIYAFILFRIFDISKPLFINKLQNLPKGWGIMIDDIVSGIIANIILQILIFLKPQFFI